MARKIAIVLFCLAALTTPSSGGPSGPDAGPIPPGEAGAKEAVERSPRLHEWADIVVPGKETKVAAFIAYPERKDKAPVVIVIQEIYGLTDWVRAVADRLAAEGFIAIAPDLLSGKGQGGGHAQNQDRFHGCILSRHDLLSWRCVATLIRMPMPSSSVMSAVPP